MIDPSFLNFNLLHVRSMGWMRKGHTLPTVLEVRKKEETEGEKGVEVEDLEDDL